MAKDGPKILILDIECAPLLSYTWGIWDQNVGLNQIAKEWSIISWAAKWMDEDKIYYADQRGSKDIEDDKEILIKLWDLMDEAQVICGHNVKRFDIKKINAKFIKHGLRPTNETQVLDTLTMAKSNFAFTSNKLSYIAEYLGVAKKGEHKDFPGFELWRECMRGNPKAWRELKKYNVQDVHVTEAVYKKLRPFCKTLNHAIYLDPEEPLVCECGSDRLHSNGFRINNAGKYKRLRCLECGKNYKQKQNQIPHAQRKGFVSKA